MTIQIIKTDVPCPNCDELICNLCLFNGMCQECKHPFKAPTLTLAKMALAKIAKEGIAMPHSHAKQDEFNQLKVQYNAIVGDSGNQFLYATTPESTTYYVFRDTKVSGIQAAIDLMYAVVKANETDTTDPH